LPFDKNLKGSVAVRLLFIVNDAGFFMSHRLPLALAAKASGYDVIVATGGGDGAEEVRRAGLDHRTHPLQRSGTNPLLELRLLLAIARLYRDTRPGVVHLVTIKPVLYGGVLSRLMGVPAAVFAISGMGYLFGDERPGLIHRLVRLMYRAALGHQNSMVIVQNEADRQQLRIMGALRRGRHVLIPGSGVDLSDFVPTPLPAGKPVIVLPARMLWDKGVGEFVEAARRVKERGLDCRFALVGPQDADNPRAVSHEELETWRREGAVEWWGKRSDMPEVYAMASLVVLPSYYREGVPKALLEAAAAGRAIITTDAPGCRDVVEDGVNGRLVPPRDADALAHAIIEILTDRAVLEEMGRRGRARAEREFGVERVIHEHMKIYQSLVVQSHPGSEHRKR
jgi:glycosyltransferase involved in cell wall biosynthesis